MADEYPTERIKHLEMIQAVVARLANEAALIRGWALTVSSAFFAFAAQSYSWRVAAVGLLPVVAFWGLNAYYLRLERQYRKLHDRVCTGAVDLFSMDASKEEVKTWGKTLWSRPLFAFYGVILAVGAILIVAGIWNHDAAPSPGQFYFLN
jgi:hypothetical protein